MRLLAFSDVHGNMKALQRLKAISKQSDLALCAGDISLMENNISGLVSMLDSFPVPVLLIPGNHEDEDGLSELASIHPNVLYLHKGAHHIRDYVFLGYGGGGFSTRDERFTQVAESFFAREISGKKKIVLMTHAPPHNTVLDALGSDHRGNKSIREFINKAEPHLAVCGHFHENAGKQQKLGRSLIINPGPSGVVVNI